MDRSVERTHARAARAGMRGVVRAGVEVWRRETMLPRLVAVAPADVADDGIPGTRRMVERLRRALREERRRGQAGHWTYDLNRHIGLMQALAAERRRPAPPGPPAPDPAS